MNSDNNSIIHVTEQSDIDNNKSMAALAYIFFFIPLLVAKESKYAMYHANQGLVLFLTALAVNIVGAILPIIGWLLIIPIGLLGILVLAVIGIVHAVNGRMEPLPLIGKIKLIQRPLHK